MQRGIKIIQSLVQDPAMYRCVVLHQLAGQSDFLGDVFLLLCVFCYFVYVFFFGRGRGGFVKLELRIVRMGVGKGDEGLGSW